MSKKFNNKILIIVLVALAGIWGLSEMFQKKDKNLKTDIVEFSAEEVSKIEIYPREGETPVTISKKGEDTWRVSDGKNDFSSSKEIVSGYIDELLKIKSQRLAATSKEKWEQFQVTDSMATRIKVFGEKDEELLHIYIGKFSYKQLQSQNPYSRNNIQGISYVRLAEEKEVYAVDGFLPMSLNRGFSDWRDKTLSKFNMEDIKTIQFSYPADSSYNVEFKDSVWYTGTTPLDMQKVQNFLSSMQNKTGFTFVNDFQPVSNPVYQIKLEGNNLTNIDIKCYAANDPGKFVIHSNQNTEAYFESDSTGLVKQIFKPVSEFLTVENNI